MAFELVLLGHFSSLQKIAPKSTSHIQVPISLVPETSQTNVCSGEALQRLDSRNADPGASFSEHVKNNDVSSSTQDNELHTVWRGKNIWDAKMRRKHQIDILGLFSPMLKCANNKQINYPEQFKEKKQLLFPENDKISF